MSRKVRTVIEDTIHELESKRVVSSIDEQAQYDFAITVLTRLLKRI